MRANPQFRINFTEILQREYDIYLNAWMTNVCISNIFFLHLFFCLSLVKMTLDKVTVNGV